MPGYQATIDVSRLGLGVPRVSIRWEIDGWWEMRSAWPECHAAIMAHPAFEEMLDAATPPEILIENIDSKDEECE